jgi:hypothetical protein
VNWRDIRTDHEARRVARSLGIDLVKADIGWVASDGDNSYYACRPVYAVRELLSQR